MALVFLYFFICNDSGMLSAYSIYPIEIHLVVCDFSLLEMVRCWTLDAYKLFLPYLLRENLVVRNSPVQEDSLDVMMS